MSKMRAVLTGAFAAAFVASTPVLAQSSSPNDFRVGPFALGLSPDEAVAAAGSDYFLALGRAGDGSISSAQAFVPFDGAEWLIEIQNESSIHRSFYDLDTSVPSANANECREAVSHVIAVLEPVFGPFGRASDFEDPEGFPFGAEWGRFVVGDAGASSRLRDYLEDGAFEEFVTLRLPGADDPFTVLVEASRSTLDGMCGLSIQIADYK
jgi:hypothetical protein